MRVYSFEWLPVLLLARVLRMCHALLLLPLCRLLLVVRDGLGTDLGAVGWGWALGAVGWGSAVQGRGVLEASWGNKKSLHETMADPLMLEKRVCVRVYVCR